MTYAEQRNKEINRLYATGRYTYAELAKRFNLSVSRIEKICTPEVKKEHKRMFKEIKNTTPRPSTNRKCNRVELATKLIEAMSDYALAFDWEDNFLIEKLLDCGIARRDFVAAGYGEFVREYFDGEVV